MNNEEIIKAVKNNLNIYSFTAKALEMLIDNVKKEEREMCAIVCERLISGDGICADDGVWIHDCAAAIRARSEKNV